MVEIEAGGRVVAGMWATPSTLFSAAACLLVARRCGTYVCGLQGLLCFAEYVDLYLQDR